MPDLRSETSEQIRVLRVLCIFFMMFVHVNPGIRPAEGEGTGALRWIGLLVIDVFGRAAVPALTIVSGLLMVNEVRRRPRRRALANRVRSLLVPMAVWNLALLALGAVLFALADESTTVHDDAVGLSPARLLGSRILALDYQGAARPLNFLRDLFVCALLYVMLEPLLRRRVVGPTTLAVVWVWGATIGFVPVVYRPHILMFYCLGVFIGLRSNTLPIRRIPLVLAAAVGVMVYLTEARVLGLHPPDAESAHFVYETMKRLAVAYLAVAASLAIARRPGLRGAFRRTERDIYLTYLGHSVAFLVLWGIWQEAFGSALEFPYLVFFLGAPVVWLIVARSFGRALDHAPAEVQTALRGKVRRVPGQIPAPAR